MSYIPVPNISLYIHSAKLKKYRLDEETIQKLQEKEWRNGSDEDLEQVGKLEFRVGGVCEEETRDEVREVRPDVIYLNQKTQNKY